MFDTPENIGPGIDVGGGCDCAPACPTPSTGAAGGRAKGFACFKKSEID